ncbi:shikimate dehydrogenase family protein [Zwartia panacis]|uniref:shikimate dehydrogenase family protein n=1 Tax=Zwartia panacis TaxID=2683345 RepID=UPI0025B427DB|nr:shikimate dehydrogenase [Zwartia panacis]MDN4015945.1 shikimate dehydrogenase [Zwartia panacis]
MMEITGHTRLYGIVADPVAQVKTPQTMRKVFEKRGTDGVLVPMHVRSEHLAVFVQGLRGVMNFGGMIATVPHKTAMLDLCDDVTPAARLVGAVNIVRRNEDGTLSGDILDGQGFVGGLRQHGIEPRGLSVFLCGAGGAAKAIAFALADAGVARLDLYNRTQSKAQDIITRLQGVYPSVPMSAVGASPTGYDLVINATSLGMKSDDPMPFDVKGLSAQQTVAEIIMTPALTPLLAAAREMGCRIQYGLPMLECQIELMADFMGVAK